MQNSMVKFNGLSGTALMSKAGKVVGSRVMFSHEGKLTASEVKAQLKQEGLKGRELTRKVNEVLTGTKDVAWARYEASVSIMRSNGFIPDYVDARKTGATARFVKPKTVTEEVTNDEALEVLAKAKGMTVADLKALIGL